MSTKEVYTEILKFSTTRPNWQRDALRIIVTNGNYKPENVYEYYTSCLQSHGIESSTASRTFEPLSKDHLPGSQVNSPKIVLDSISEVNNVNILHSDQRLYFAKEGLTVIYGDNGAGKSGYGRILKGATRARGKKAKVLPNAYKPDTSTPSAKIDYLSGLITGYYVWSTAAEAADENLSQISFFDSESSSVYFEKTNTPAFTPFGLDVLPKLVALCSALQDELRSHKSRIETQKSAALKQLEQSGKSKVNDFLKSLKAESDMAEARKLASLLPAERSRLNELRTILAHDDSFALETLQIKLKHLVALKEMANRVRIGLDDNSYTQARNECNLAEATATLSAADFSEAESLPVGTKAWRELWQSARRFSELEAYMGEAFPFTTDGAKCVLCQQEMDHDCAARLIRFDDFVKSNTQRKFEVALAKFKAEERRIKELPLAKLLRIGHLDAIGEDHRELAQELRHFFILARLNQRQLLRTGSSSNRWTDITKLDSAIEKVKSTIDQLRLTNSGNTEKPLVQEAGELEDRLFLSRILGDVELEIARLQMLSKIDAAIAEVSTGNITKKGGELSEKFINLAVQNAFKDEINILGLARTGVNLVSGSGSAGTKLWHLEMAGITNPNLAKASLTQILSQGEQRAIALAAFLAELSMDDSKSSLIFDDPVSSLDHATRQAIAERLIKEAKVRQVIVFTHDTVFAFLLQESSEKHTTPLAMRQIYRGTTQSGICENDLPWIAKNTSQRIGSLKDELQRLASLERKNLMLDFKRDVGYFYVQLRETWERATEEILLNDSIARFRRSVQTQRLKCLTDIDSKDLATIEEGMTQCSKYAHDEATAINGPPPTAAEMDLDIKSLEEWVKTIRTRRKK